MIYKTYRTEVFRDWINSLRDVEGKALIFNNIDRMREGNFGNSEPVGSGVFEKKINYGPGYRIYYYFKQKQLIILLCGGDKSTQQVDINYAIRLKESLDE